MPTVLQHFHGAPGSFVARGRVTVIGATNPLARLVAWLMGAPTRDDEGEFQLERILEPTNEIWVRSFPGHRFRSVLHAAAPILIESMGPFSARSRVIWAAPCLRLELQHVHFCGIPVPAFLLPGLHAEEHVEGQRLHFNIDTRAPLVGRLFAYRGYLEVVA